jgi:protoporphyrinogen/coproporphyrinogen III oxidase
MTSPRVIVVGGGITGLSAAFTLQEDARRLGAPLSLTVLEATAAPGGHAQTIDADGFLIEAGPNGFLNREPETLSLVEALDLGPRLISARKEASRRFIVRGGRLCEVPDSPPSLIRSPALSWAGKLRLLMEPFASGPPGTEETVHAFATRRIGGEAADMLVDAAVSGISAGDSRVLSVDAQFPIMTEMERDHGGLFRAMFARRKSGKGPPALLGFDRGMGTLTGALADRLGPAMRYRSAVRDITRAGAAWRLRLYGSQAVEADHVVLAASAHAAAPMLSPLDPQLSVQLASFAYEGVAVVALGYDLADIPQALDGYGYLVTRPEGLATLGVVWESSLFAGRAADGTALLRVFLGGARRRDIVGAAHPVLIEIARRELAAVMGIRAEPRHASVFAWPKAIAQYTVGHLQRRDDIRARLGRYPGLTVCGTSYDGVSFNHAVKSGRAAAQALATRLWDGADRHAGAGPEFSAGAMA